MNIAVNTLAVGIAGGKYNIKMLLRNLLRLDNNNKYFVFVSPKLKKELIFHTENTTYLAYRFPSRNVLNRFIWEQIILPFILKKYSIDIVYNISSIDLFFAPCRTIINISNMAPYSKEVISLVKSYKAKLRLLALSLLSKISSKTATGIIIHSNSALNELAEKENFPRNKMRAVLCSVDIDSLKGKDLPLKIRSAIDHQEFILCVSHIHRYKKLENIILAYKKIIQNDRNLPKLIFVGAPLDHQYFSELNDLIQKEDLNDNIVFLGLVARESLHNLYNACNFLIFNSIVETCPLTLIEALKCGTPILCSSGGPMVEICDNAALYFNPNSYEELANKIMFVLNNKKLLSEMSSNSKIRARYFLRENTAKETLKFFREIYNLPK